MTKEEVTQFFNMSKWVVAKSYAKTHPHEYIVCEVNGENRKEFETVVSYIRKNGVKERFYTMSFIYLYLDGYKYWTMGAPVKETIIINRVMDTKEYNKIADKYDSLFLDKESLKENEDVKRLLTVYFSNLGFKSILDIGCGTGLLYEMFGYVDGYVGIDPSQKMLDVFRTKTDKYQLLCLSFEDFFKHNSDKKFDAIVCLFASVNYVEPTGFEEKIYSLLNKGGKFFLMFYKNDYYPVTYKRVGFSMKHHLLNEFNLTRGYKKEFNNFVIYTNEIL